MIADPAPLGRSVGQRGAAALLGLVTGHAVGLESRPGAAGLDVVRHDTPFSPHHADVALALLTAQALTGATVDVQKMAHGWVDWLAADGRGASDSLRAALDLIRTTGAPPESGRTAGVEPVLRAVPIAIKVHASNANLLSGPLHLGALTHPDARAGWSAVALAIALARLVAGHRDFIADVLEALRVNGAPPELQEALRRVPVRRRADWAAVFAGEPAIAVTEAALWCAYHEPLLERGVSAIAELDVAPATRAAAAALAAALMAARDGEGELPARWVAAVPQAAATAALGAKLAGRDAVA